jgi:hypothetical protein
MSNNKRTIDSTIIAAVIGVMGTLCVTLITLYANRVNPLQTPVPPTSPPLPSEVQPSLEPTWTASPTVTLTEAVAPTDTVPAGQDTSTPEPDTPTPEATSTLAPPALGSDWSNGCISVAWRPFPETIQTSENSGCLTITNPLNLFFAGGGRLTFLVNSRFDNPQVFGLFAPLPANGTVSVSTFVRALQGGEIWMGVFAEPSVESQGLVMAISGSGRDRVLDQKSMPSQEVVRRVESLPQVPPLYDVGFNLNSGEVTANALRNTVTFDVISLGSAQHWLFVGYRVLGGNERAEIDAEFLNLVVQGQ